VCGTNRKIHIAKKEENNLRTTTKGIIFIELLSCAQLLRSCIYSFQDSGRMTAAAMDCKRRMGNIRVISTPIWSQPIALLQLFTALMLYSQSASHKMVSDQMCTHRFW
jgi:hypothetical protein